MSALIWFGYNQKEAYEANKKAEQLVSELTAQIQPSEINTATEQMQTVAIAGDAYMGYLTMPNLQLHMPIMSEWSQSKLKTAPCRYTGSVDEKNLVIMGHNYANGFGELSQLQVGDAVYFHDVQGETMDYQVKAIEVLPADAVDEMVNSAYDLTLFTCTYNGQNRLTIRCQQNVE